MQHTSRRRGRGGWRALALVVKAKLKAIESGIASFEQELYAHTVLPSGRTVSEDTGDQVSQMIASGDARPTKA